MPFCSVVCRLGSGRPGQVFHQEHVQPSVEIYWFLCIPLQTELSFTDECQLEACFLQLGPLSLHTVMLRSAIFVNTLKNPLVTEV